MTKIHLSTWMMRTQEVLQTCFCTHVELMVKGGSEMNPGSVPDMPPSFLLPWWNPLSSGMAAGSKLLQTRHRHEGGRMRWGETFKSGNFQSREVVLGEEKFYHVIMKQWQFFFFFHFNKQPVADGFKHVISPRLDMEGKERNTWLGVLDFHVKSSK